MQSPVQSDPKEGPVSAHPVAPRSGRATILDAIRGAGSISRVELVRSTGLTGATVSTTVRRLIEDGLVVETGREPSTGGKPRTQLSLDPLARFAVGTHLDSAGITYVLADLAGGVVGRWRTPGLGIDAPPAVVHRIAAEVRGLLAGIGTPPERVLGLGIVAPGPLTPSAAMVLTPPQMERWRSFPLAGALEDATGLPVLLDNDATAAAVGEYWSGTVAPTTAFAALYMGSGIGGGVMVDGVAYRGASSNAGEVGHVCVELDGPECWCGARGCIEAVAGPAAVVEQARSAGLLPPEPGTRSVLEEFAALTRTALRGGEAAEALLRRSARYVAVAAQAMTNLMDLDLVVLTGPAFGLAGSLYLPAVEKQLAASAFARRNHPVRVIISPNAPDAAAIGGAALVLQTELTPVLGARGPVAS